MFVLLWLSLFSWSQESKVCSQALWSAYSWCAHGEVTGQPQPVVYYLHGNGGTEESWDTTDHSQLRAIWREHNFAPLVVTISFGKTWFMTSDRLREFVQRALPTIEQELRVRASRRLLFGESMGGFNALQIYFRAPQVFSRVMVACPALPGFSPYASSRDIEAFYAAYPYVSRKLADKWVSKLREAFRTPALWSAHDPLVMASAGDLTGHPSILLHGDDADPMGFFPATDGLRLKLRDRGARLTWVRVPQGGHCAQTAATWRALARFAM